MLLYPSKTSSFSKDDFTAYHQIDGKIEHHKCALGKLTIFKEDNITLDISIGETILAWF